MKYGFIEWINYGISGGPPEGQALLGPPPARNTEFLNSIWSLLCFPAALPKKGVDFKSGFFISYFYFSPKAF